MFPVPFNRPEGTLPVNRTQTVLYLTVLIFLLRKVNCQMNWMPLSPTLTSPSRRNNLIDEGDPVLYGMDHILDMDTTAGSSDDNPFAGPRLQTLGKVSVQLPTDEWLC